jgi:hypothetical protein
MGAIEGVDDDSKILMIDRISCWRWLCSPGEGWAQYHVMNISPAKERAQIA